LVTLPAEIRIYFEGDKRLRPGFSAFLSEIRERGKAKRCKIEIIATGGTPVADFRTAMKMHPNAWNILLRDSEGPDDGKLSATLVAAEGWQAAVADSIFWMVQMMESWFHADKDALERFYRDGFKRQALAANPKVEEIAKRDLEEGLNAATRGTKKGKYHKGNHAPSLLEMISPQRVRDAAPNCQRLFKVILSALS
jgi:Domain of unknown function (DUF4276)